MESSVIQYNDRVSSLKDYDASKGLLISKIFGPTLQGEMPFSGVPAIFVRLAGCHRGAKDKALGCKFCDTDFRFANGRYMTVKEIRAEIRPLMGYFAPTKLIVISGGEPLLQDIKPLIENLLESGYRVQIETTGDIYRELKCEPYSLYLTVVISPKQKYTVDQLDQRWFNLDRNHTLALRCLIETGDSCYSKPLDMSPLTSKGHATPTIYLSPIAVWKKAMPDGHNPSFWTDDQYLDREATMKNYIYAAKLCIDYGYQMSVQTHQLTGSE